MPSLPTHRANPWTPAEIEAEIEWAWHTLRRLPGGDPASRLSRLRSAWPDAPHKAEESYGYNRLDAPRMAPDGVAIDAAERVLAWMAQHCNPDALTARRLPVDLGQVLWLRAGGLSWRGIALRRRDVWGRVDQRGRTGGRLAIPGGASPPSIRLLHARALSYLTDAVNGRLSPPRARRAGKPVDERERFPVGW